MGTNISGTRTFVAPVSSSQVLDVTSQAQSLEQANNQRAPHQILSFIQAIRIARNVFTAASESSCNRSQTVARPARDILSILPVSHNDRVHDQLHDCLELRELAQLERCSKPLQQKVHTYYARFPFLASHNLESHIRIERPIQLLKSDALPNPSPELHSPLLQRRGGISAFPQEHLSHQAKALLHSLCDKRNKLDLWDRSCTHESVMSHLDIPIKRNQLWGNGTWKGVHPHITELSLWVNQDVLRHETVKEALAKCPNLTHIYLCGPKDELPDRTPINVQAFGTLPKGTRTLFLGSGIINDDILLSMTKDCTELRNLTVCESPEITDRSLTPLIAANPHLEAVTLDSCKVPDATLNALRGRSLVRLHLSTDNSTRLGLKVFLSNQSSIHTLTLSGQSLEDDTVLHALPNMQSLIYLDISECPRLSDKTLDGLRKFCPKLDSLVLCKGSDLYDDDRQTFNSNCGLFSNIKYTIKGLKSFYRHFGNKLDVRVVDSNGLRCRHQVFDRAGNIRALPANPVSGS